MTVVFITLAVSILLFGCVASLAFFDVAFSPPRPVTATGEPNPWQPPMIQGADLFAWARQNANRLASALLSGRRDARVVADLASQIRSGADYAMGLSHDDAVREWDLEEKCYSMKSLTPPEVIEIAEFIRQSRPVHEVQSIASRAADNGRRAYGLNRMQYRQAGIRCPLLSEDGRCTVQGVEPVQCRSGRPLGGHVASMVVDPSATRRSVETHARSVALGVELGLSEAVEAAGLDGRVGEFNRALGVALNTPDAAEKWVHGHRMSGE